MDVWNLVLGILLIVGGILLIIVYNDLVKQKQTSNLSFKLKSGGYFSIVIGIALIVREIF